MAGDGSGGHYIQSGWIKQFAQPGGGGPHYFIEYAGTCGSSSFCRTIFELVPSGTIHNYAVERISFPHNWCAKIDNVSKGCVAASTLGLSNGAPIIYFSGETWDTQDQMADNYGTHVRFSTLRRKTSPTSGWTFMGNLYSITTSGTDYRAALGNVGLNPYVDNWTIYPP